MKTPLLDLEVLMLRDKVIRHSRFSAIIGAALLLALPFDTIPLPIKAKVIPLASLLALLFFPFRVQHTRKTPLFIAVVLFVSFTMVHSLVALLVALYGGDDPLRLTSTFRQMSALLVGFSLFIVLRRSLLHLSDRKIVRYIVIGSLPALVLAILNIFWGTFGQQWAGSIVVALRDLIAPLGYTSPFRASGFALEPSTFSTYLAIVLMPTLLIRLWNRQYHLSSIVLLILAGAAFCSTFSMTGFSILFVILVAGLVFGPKRRLILNIGILFLLILVWMTMRFPENKIVYHGSRLLEGKTDVSFIDRFYSTAGPFMNSLSFYSILGYGLGGTASHFSEIVPESFQADIASVKWKGMPSLSTLVGRIFAETGLLGFILFLFIIRKTFWELHTQLRNRLPSASRLFLSGVRLGLFGTLMGITFGFGSFHNPYLWLWIAVIDSHYLKSLRVRSTELHSSSLYHAR